MSDKLNREQALRLSGLEVQLGGRRILGPLDLCVESGEHVLIVGASGSGKSTLLRSVAGLERPSAGRVEIFGALASEGARQSLAPQERSLGLMFQGAALWPHMSVARTLDFVLRQRGLDKRQRGARAARLLSLVELEGFESRLPGTLSGGERQRLALARALASEPRLLLLDEPMGPLDAELRGALLARLASTQQELGLTILHVTHDPKEARALASRVLRLEAGRVIEDSLQAAEPSAEEVSQ